MIINHNMSALYAYGKLGENVQKLSKSMMKLSSGLRINQAGDDAAGLAISEKMRAQIRGLQQAERNVQDGVSLVQTADSGLDNIQEQLQRARELAVRAANDTLTQEDRSAIQLEMEQIKQGIDSIANNTEFNGIYLLNREGTKRTVTIENGGGSSFNYQNTLSLAVDSAGKLSLKTDKGYPGTALDDGQRLIYEGTGGYGTTSLPQVLIKGKDGSVEGYKLKDYVSQETTSADGVFTTVYQVDNVEVTQEVSIIQDKFEFKYMIQNNGSEDKQIGFFFHLDTMLGNDKNDSSDDSEPFIINGTTIQNEVEYTKSNMPDSFTIYDVNGNTDLMAQGIISGDSIKETPDKFIIDNYYDLESANNWNPDDKPITDVGYALQWDARAVAPGESFEAKTFYGLAVPPTIPDPTLLNTITETIPCELQLQVGANSGDIVKIELSDVRATALDIADLSVSTHEGAGSAIENIDKAIQKVSSEQAKYGACQNQLDHINSNLENYYANLTDAESRIRDLDIAKEIMNLTKASILSQTAQALLAQANQIPEAVLHLLK